MGVERTIRHDPTAALDWAAVAARLREAGETPVVRMINGLPAFPDEIPEGGWAEVRVSLSGGMVTVRRQPGRVTLVTWGTSDPGLTQSADRLESVITELTQGSAGG